MSSETSWRDAVKATVRDCINKNLVSQDCMDNDWIDEITYQIADKVFNALEISKIDQDKLCNKTIVAVIDVQLEKII